MRFDSLALRALGRLARSRHKPSTALPVGVPLARASRCQGTNFVLAASNDQRRRDFRSMAEPVEIRFATDRYQYQATGKLPWQNPEGGAHSPVARSSGSRPGDYRMRPGNETRGNSPPGRRTRPFIFGGHRSTGLHGEHRRILEPWGGSAPSGENRGLHDCHRIRAAGPRSSGGPRSVR